MKLGSKDLRVKRPTEEQLARIDRKPIYITLDNVMDTYNVGAIFRLADAVAASEVILCGGTEYPPNTRLHKAAVGTEEWVPWRYVEKPAEAIGRLQADGVRVVAVEQDERSVSIYSSSFMVHRGEPVAIVVGHETDGVSKEVLDMADVIVEIPMWGVNKSLNVVVSMGIVLYKLLDG